jgi:HSP20 family protein
MEMTGPNFYIREFAICQFKEKKIEIELAALGLKKEDFKIELIQMLTISSEKNKKRREKR